MARLRPSISGASRLVRAKRVLKLSSAESPACAASSQRGLALAFVGDPSFFRATDSGDESGRVCLNPAETSMYGDKFISLLSLNGELSENTRVIRVW